MFGVVLLPSLYSKWQGQHYKEVEMCSLFVEADILLPFHVVMTLPAKLTNAAIQGEESDFVGLFIR